MQYGRSLRAAGFNLSLSLGGSSDDASLEVRLQPLDGKEPTQIKADSAARSLPKIYRGAPVNVQYAGQVTPQT